VLWDDIDAALAHAAPERLDEAWAEAVAALPEGWAIGLIASTKDDWTSSCYGPNWLATQDEREYVAGDGPTPAAALRALAARLSQPDATEEAGTMTANDDGDHSAFTHRDDDEPPPYVPASNVSEGICAACWAGRHAECDTFDCQCDYRPDNGHGAASNVSEGLREAILAVFPTTDGAGWEQLPHSKEWAETKAADLRAALAHAAPERLDAASLAEEGLDAIEDAITLLEAAPAYLWTAGEPDETIAALRALAARLRSQPDATEGAER
jgi:hypothetical protein